jgi:hypothetical protein
MTACTRVLQLSTLLIAALAGLPHLTLAAGQEKELDMDGMSVIGNSELPKALFIVPWKDPEAALTPESPVNSLVDEALQPVDPEVFRRKLDYFDTVHRKD